VKKQRGKIALGAMMYPIMTATVFFSPPDASSPAGAISGSSGIAISNARIRKHISFFPISPRKLTAANGPCFRSTPLNDVRVDVV
jgi:hypothetical protein